MEDAGTTHADVMAWKLDRTAATSRAPAKSPGGMCPFLAASVGHKQKVEGAQMVARGASARRTQLCSFGSEWRTVTRARGRSACNEARSSCTARAEAQSQREVQ